MLVLYECIYLVPICCKFPLTFMFACHSNFNDPSDSRDSQWWDSPMMVSGTHTFLIPFLYIFRDSGLGVVLLMEEILHQLIGSLSHYLQGFIHPRWCRISSINSMGIVWVGPWKSHLIQLTKSRGIENRQTSQLMIRVLGCPSSPKRNAWSLDFITITCPKTNMEPENDGFS